MTDPSQDADFNELDFEEQKAIFFKSSFEEKGDLLLRSQDPDQLANVMSCEEMYLMTRNMDIDLRAEILKHANLPQLFFVADLDCWSKDQINPKNFLDWLECLFLADPEKLAGWLSHIDYEMLVAGFKKYVGVIKPEREYPADEILGDRAYFTLDMMYYVLCDEDNLDLVKRALHLIYETEKRLYVNLLEGLISELDYEMEEEAFRHRNVRLSERGFPEEDSAMQIYRPISEDEWKKLPKKEINMDSVREGQVMPANYPVLWSEEKLFLDDVLGSLASESIEVIHSLQEELVWLSNKVLSCSGIQMASEQKVRNGIERVRRFVNIGLEEVSQSDVEVARPLVLSTWLEFLFRKGFTEIIDVRSELTKCIQQFWKKNNDAFLNFLGIPYENMCRGLLKTQPQCFDTAETHDLEQLRDFKNMDEIKASRVFVQVLNELHECLVKQCPNLFSVLLIEADGKDDPTTLLELIGTLLVRSILDEKIQFKEITKKELDQFLKKGGEQAGIEFLIHKKFIETFVAQMTEGHQDNKKLEQFLYQIIETLQSELHTLSIASDINYKYVRCVKLKD